jgi:hypothetical protein
MKITCRVFSFQAPSLSPLILGELGSNGKNEAFDRKNDDFFGVHDAPIGQRAVKKKQLKNDSLSASI